MTHDFRTMANDKKKGGVNKAALAKMIDRQFVLIHSRRNRG